MPTNDQPVELLRCSSEALLPFSLLGGVFPTINVSEKGNFHHTRFFASLRALLSLLFLNNSMIRFSYGAVLNTNQL